ncbi:MAG: hypothetical protein ABSC08_02055 [Bryobacteraceae bacterium]|jgi:hypothetical protein
MRALAIVLLLTLVHPASSQQAQAPPGELERVEKTLQYATDLKAKLAAMSAQLDQFIAELSEQKGALQNKKPAPFGGIADSGPADPAKPKAARCAAMTAKGERCTRPAVAGSRYCRQHQVARQ